MTQFANGSSAAVSLLGGDSGPPVGPPTIGRPPSNFEAPPIPLTTFPKVVAAASEPAETGLRRLIVRLLGGGEVELGNYENRGEAMKAAQELVTRFSAAEATGDWPEIDGRFLRPGAVASIDVLVTA